MHVFVTGASVFVGTAVVKELIAAGYQVTGLARSDSSAEKVTKTGAAVQRGSLEDVEALKTAVAKADGVIHCGFLHDFSDFPKSCEVGRHAIQAMGEALASTGSGKPLIVTSGTMQLPKGRLVTEEDGADMSNPMSALRGASDALTLSLAASGVRACLMRLPPTVHGEGDHGLVPMVISKSREKGATYYIGDGQNPWAAVHVLDAAKAFRLALEKGVAGASYHAVAEQGIPTKDFVKVIGKQLGVSVAGIPMEEALEHYSFFAWILSGGNLASSKKTGKDLGWTPSLAGLIADLEAGHYFKN